MEQGVLKPLALGTMQYIKENYPKGEYISVVEVFACLTTIVAFVLYSVSHDNKEGKALVKVFADGLANIPDNLYAILDGGDSDQIDLFN